MRSGIKNIDRTALRDLSLKRPLSFSTNRKAMKTNISRSALIAISLLAFCIPAFAQLPVKRTIYRTETLDFGAGGTLSVAGAPNGSIRVEGWDKNEVEISAEIEIQAPSEADADLLAKVTGFVLEESIGRTGITSLGTHDKKYLRRAAKKFPKELIGLPFKIDYVIRTPRFCDLQIDGGKGDLKISGIEGTMKVNFLQGNARLDLVGGGILATFGEGRVDVRVPTRSWRGRFADISLVSGTMNVDLPVDLSAELDASILRVGEIKNTFPGLKKRTRTGEFTDKLIEAKAGAGGIPLKFTVGDGTINISPNNKQD